MADKATAELQRENIAIGAELPPKLFPLAFALAGWSPDQWALAILFGLGSLGRLGS